MSDSSWSSNGIGRAVLGAGLLSLLFMAGCGGPPEGEDRVHDGRMADTTEVGEKTLRDSLTALFQGGARDLALELAEARWTQDSLNWAHDPSATTWRQWAQDYHQLMMDPLVGLVPERAVGMMGVLIERGKGFAEKERLLLAVLHKEHSKYLNRLGRKDEALLTARKGYAMLSSTGDTINKEAIGLLNALGIRTFALGDYDGGVGFFERSIRVARALKDPEQEATQMLRLAAYIPATDSTTAMQLFRDAERIALSGGDTATWCKTLNGRAVYVYNNFGDYDSSAVLQSARLSSAWSEYDPETYSASLANAIIYCRENDLYFELDRLLVGYEQKVASLPFDPLLLASLRTSQAEAYKAKHDSRAAMAFATEAVSLVKEYGVALKSPQTSIRAFLVLTAGQSWAGDYPAAIATAEEALGMPVFYGSQEHTIRNHILANLANAQGRNGDPHHAISSMLPLLEDASLRQNSLNNVGKFYRELGARTLADSCNFLVLMESEVNSVQRTEANIALSEDRAARNLPLEADAFAKNALIACGAIDPTVVGRPVIRYAPNKVSQQFDATKQWCRCLNGSIPLRPDRPIATLELLACDSVFRIMADTLLRTTRDPVARSGLLDLMTESLDRSIRKLTDGSVEPIPWRKVLRLMELRRDHRWRSMQREEQASLLFGVPETLVLAERSLVGMLDAIQRKEVTDAGNEGRSAITVVRDSLSKVITLIKAIAPGYYAALNGLDPTDPGMVMSKLGQEEHVVMLHLDTVDHSLTSVHMTRGSITGHRDPLGEDDIAALILSLRSAKPREDMRTSQMVRSIFGPTLKGSTGATMIILPDGPLWGVPFDVLWAANGDTLTETANIRYATSLSALTKATTVAPTVAPIEMMAFAPTYTSGTNGTVVVSRSGALRDLGPLVESVNEVTDIVDMVGGDKYVAENAQESGFRTSAPSAGIVHLAMHGVIDEVEPLRSYLLFEQGDTTTENNGRLTISEIYDLKLNADLAVLSACETGIGKSLSGEGVMSIGRAFAYAGVPNIVSSLWKVDDLATKQIMVKFYEHLAEGMGKADALAEAKRWYRTEYPNEPPSKWAAFILIGDNEPVHLKKRSRTWPWMAGGAFVVILAAIVARRRRRQRLAA